MANPGIGAMAELLCVPFERLRKIPDNMSFNTASGFPMV